MGGGIRGVDARRGRCGAEVTTRRLSSLQKHDGRTKTARLIRDMRADLVAHVGGRPSATQRVLIDRAVTLAAHLDRMDAEAFANGGMSDHARRQYLAWDGSLRRALLALGLTGKPQRAPTLRDYTAANATA